MVNRKVAALEFAARLARAYRDAHTVLACPEEVRLEQIGPRALEAFGTWTDRFVGWNRAILAPAMRRNPACFNLAIWHRGTLCGLSVGSTVARRRVAIDFLEGNPDPEHPLKGRIIEVTLTAAEAYRILVAAPELRLANCAPDLMPRYREFGFELAPSRGETHDMIRRD